MIEGTSNLFNFNFFSNFKVNLLKLTDNITNTISNTISSSLDLISPDTLFISTPKSKSIYENFSFLDNSLPNINNISPITNYSLPTLDKNIIGRNQSLASEKLKKVTPQELKELGAKDKKEFFKTLLPAALEAERIYGVPASVTLAQAALESGWARSPIGGYNIFGIKGRGPAGTVNVRTKEWENGRYISINANFAKYNNFEEAIMKHGQVFHAGYKGYNKGLQGYAANKNDYQFIDAVGSTYATSPTYKNDIKKIMKDYDLVNMAKNYYIS